eukprot:1379770-Alexandrium_andersonii.AAC.1
MAWLSTLMTPLARALREMQVIPRVYADDLGLSARGEGHWRRVRVAGGFAFRFLRDAGSRASAGKSNLSSTTAHMRALMRDYQWPDLDNGKIPVVLACRDLGSHISYGARMFANTL